jgi:hypothetical protein
MNFGGRSNEGVHGMDRPSSGVRQRYYLAPSIGNSTINRQDAALEAQWQIIPEPFVEPLPASASSHALNSTAKLRQGDNADEGSIIINLSQPTASSPSTGGAARASGPIASGRIAWSTHRDTKDNSKTFC